MDTVAHLQMQFRGQLAMHPSDQTVRTVNCSHDQTIGDVCESLDPCPDSLTVTAFFSDPNLGDPFVVTKPTVVQEVCQL